MGGELQIRALMKNMPRYSITQDYTVSFSDDDYGIDLSTKSDAVEFDMPSWCENDSRFVLSLLL